MKKVLLITASLFIATVGSGCHFVIGETIRGSGVKASETREIAQFSQLELSSALKAKVFCGEDASLEILGDDNIVSHVMVEQTDGILKLKMDHGSYSPKQPLEIVLTCQSLSSLGVSGACHVEVEGVACDRFLLSASGASKIALEGKADQLSVDVSGATKVESRELPANDVQVEASGASKVAVYSSQSLKVDASGASKIKFAGDPADKDFDTSGAASVESVGLAPAK
jgi:hypothetical protein